MNAFKNMTNEAKVWVYVADRPLLPVELQQLNDSLQRFAISWESHGKNLNSAAAVQYDRFLVFMVDKGGEGKACGRAIDNSIRYIQELEEEFGIHFLNRMLLAYEKEGKVTLCLRDELLQKMADDEINDNTMVFNTLVKSKEEYLNSFKIPFAKSWMALMTV